MQRSTETKIDNNHKFVKINPRTTTRLPEIIIAGEIVHNDFNNLKLYENSASIRIGSKTIIWFNETEKLTFINGAHHLDNWVIDEQNHTVYYKTKHKMRLPSNTILSGHVYGDMFTLNDYANGKLVGVVYFDDGIKIIQQNQTNGWSIKDGKIVYNGVVYDKETDKIITKSDNFAVIAQYDPSLGSDLFSVLEYRNNRMFCIEGSIITEIIQVESANNYRNVELLLKNTEFAKFVLEQNEKIIFAIKHCNAKYEDIILSLYDEYYTKHV